MIKVSVTVCNLFVNFLHITHCFHLHQHELCLSNININAPVAHFYGFCKVTVAKKTCLVIFGFDVSRTFTNDPNSTDLSNVLCHCVSSHPSILF